MILQKFCGNCCHCFVGITPMNKIFTSSHSYLTSTLIPAHTYSNTSACSTPSLFSLYLSKTTDENLNLFVAFISKYRHLIFSKYHVPQLPPQACDTVSLSFLTPLRFILCLLSPIFFSRADSRVQSTVSHLLTVLQTEKTQPEWDQFFSVSLQSPGATPVPTLHL